MAPKTST